MAMDEDLLLVLHTKNPWMNSWWIHGTQFSRIEISQLCTGKHVNNGSGPLEISWKGLTVWALPHIKGFSPRRGLTYVKTRPLSSTVFSQGWPKWQIRTFGLPPKCHMATFLVYSWYGFCNRVFKAQNITRWDCLVLGICATFNSVYADLYVYNCQCTIDVVHPLPVSYLHVQHMVFISMWNLPSITHVVAYHTLV